MPDDAPFWTSDAAAWLSRLEASADGLSTAAAVARLARYGPNRLKGRRRTDALTLLAKQFITPVILILLAAATLSFFLHDATDAFIIYAIVAASGLLGFGQERGAARAVEKLLAAVRVSATVLRDGRPTSVPMEEVVPGDVALVAAGAAIPGDGVLLAAKDLFVDEAALTGESYPAEKDAVTGAPPSRAGAVFMGTHVVSGTGRVLVVATGRRTEFGDVAVRLRARPPETEFEHGVRRFGTLLMEITLFLVIAIFAVNVLLARPVLDSLLFSLALAVGLTPQLLPAVISVNLARGARRMARAKVIVKRLAAIENFGSMNVFCSDKTGTLTEGRVRLHAAMGVGGAEDPRVLLYAYLNAGYSTGFANPIDAALREAAPPDAAAYEKLDEVPYDFVRKRVSILVARGSERLLLTKGALANVVAACDRAEVGGKVVPLGEVREQIEGRFRELSAAGYRTLGVAYRELPRADRVTPADEAAMVFLGFLSFADPPKAGVSDVLARLGQLGVAVKVITGDNRLVAANVGREVGLGRGRVLTGDEMRAMSDEALVAALPGADIFAEVEPNQKERIIIALRKAGYVVGYMGDGINDASALHAADVGLSVEGAADVAKDAADIVLMEKDLGVLAEGVRAGRLTFANTLKYVFMASSANFGNMFSMAGASLFLKFIPLLPKQVLLTNLMTDFPEMNIAGDRVDAELVAVPRRWNMTFIRTFMLFFGLLSSVFDYLTFGALLLLLHASRAEFRTAWFAESVISASLIVLVVRTRRPFFRSLPGHGLAIATVGVVAAVLLLPYTPLAPLMGFAPLPPAYVGAVGLIVVAYVIAAEAAKHVFYRKVNF